MSELREYCFRCQTTTPSKAVRHATYTEYLCAVCGWQVDCDVDYPSDEEQFEPIGSCEECGSNLYEDDDPELCDQCLWARNVCNLTQGDDDAD